MADHKKIKKVIIIAGKPAAGKGTQCQLLVERYGLIHISTGDLLREKRKDLKELAEYMDHGKLVPDELVIKVLSARLQSQDVLDNGVLIDGFPRTMAQAEALSTRVKADRFIYLDVPDKVVLGRISGRRIDPITGHVYHLKYNPPSSHEVTDRLIRRSDDTPEKMKTRLDEFRTHMSGLLKFFQNILTPIKIDEQSTPELVFEEVRKVLEGDDYWGRSIKSVVSVRAAECGSRARSLVSAARLFEHSRWQMAIRGCLADAYPLPWSDAVAVSSSIMLSRNLRPYERLQLECWLSGVGSSSVTLGHNLYALQHHPDVTDNLPPVHDEKKERLVARGYSTMVVLDPKTHKPIKPKKVDYLRALSFHDDPPLVRLDAAPGALVSGLRAVSSLTAPAAKKLEDLKLSFCAFDFVVLEADLASGQMSPAQFIVYVEQCRYFALKLQQQHQQHQQHQHIATMPLFCSSRLELTACELPLSKIHTEHPLPAREGDVLRLVIWQHEHDRSSLGVEIYYLASLSPTPSAPAQAQAAQPAAAAAAGPVDKVQASLPVRPHFGVVCRGQLWLELHSEL